MRLMGLRTTHAEVRQAQTPRTGRVVVIGAGVSGCSAALALASRGIPVLLLNSGLDSVGLPGYGPAVEGNAGIPGGAPTLSPPVTAEDVLEALGEASPALRDVWLEHAWTWYTAVGEAPNAPAGSGVVIDRRAVSLGTKWRIENEELIELRQGLAVSVEERGETGVVVRTVFGEELQGRAALVAVGLALGGRICVGEQETAGGRYGEVAADALLDQLLSRGSRFEAVETLVGARLQSVQLPRENSADPTDRLDGYRVRGASSGASLMEVELRPLAPPDDLGPQGSEGENDSQCHPPSPYEGSGARGPKIAYVLRNLSSAADAADPVESSLPAYSGCSSETRAADPAGCSDLSRGTVTSGWSGAYSALALMPDGIATGEWYFPPEAVALLGAAGESPVRNADGETVDVLRMGCMSRPPHTIHGFVASCGEGRMLPGVWVAGQAAGASGYVASLSSGWRVGLAIAGDLARDGDRR